MKTPKEFDYDLWKDEAGKYFIRVKQTREVCEVTIDTFRILRNEAMAMYRSQKGLPVYGKKNGKSILVECVGTVSIDLIDSNGMNSAWVSDNGKECERIINKIAIEEFKQILTEKQLEVLNKCLSDGMLPAEFAREKGISKRAVSYTIEAIIKKAKKYFY